MPNYKKMYFRLFNQVSEAMQILQKAQQDGEEAFISDPEPAQVDLIDLHRDEAP